MKNKTRTIIFLLGTLLFTYQVYISAKKDYADIKFRFKPDHLVLFSTPVYKKASVKSQIIDSLSPGTPIKAGKKIGEFFPILYIEENTSLKGNFIHQDALQKITP
ncbi:hypothetical protein ABXT08_12340 [Chryseobacterium sp. NRRL B-14859]|uniref:hypothetical protein n=1 Tax=unclassified Chryseobacterium TaxID=2593645 RepID=UPI000F44F002|nr:hypothetical protein [Chryseobacterium sp. G0240]ROI05057.1 hypothetical protein EGI16_06965 [Chryseobacterium sp. G0240]